MITAIIIGFLTGLSVAILGAWKDTMYEGFSVIKFIRSPLCGCLGAVVAYLIYGSRLDIFLLFACAVTIERLMVETYKMLHWPYKPGKFSSPTRDRGWLIKRLTGRR